MNDDNKRLLEQFLAYLQLKGSRKRGISGIKRRVPVLLEYLEANDIDVRMLKVKNAASFQGWLLERTTKTGNRYDTNTILAWLTAATSFYEFLKKKHIAHTNPFKEIRKLRQEKKLPRNILKEKETACLLAELARFDQGQNLKQKITRYRVHVAAELMYSTGLRIAEVSELVIDDIDLRRKLLYVREGKKGFSRVAFLNDYAAEVLRLYIEKMRPLVRNEWNERNGALLFGAGFGWFSKVVNRILNETSHRLGYSSFRSHGFRHALGYHLLRSGCGIRDIQVILGHRRLKTTEIYTKVDKEELKEVLDRCHPRKWRMKEHEEIAS
jgi:site-specific recombinase XerD